MYNFLYPSHKDTYQQIWGKKSDLPDGVQAHTHGWCHYGAINYVGLAQACPKSTILCQLSMTIQ